MEKDLAIHAFTLEGLALARRVAAAMPADVYAPAVWATEGEAQGFHSLRAHMEQVFHAYRQHFFIGATGIAVRAIAPCLRGKGGDPAVVAADQRGAHVVSLLGGHMAGANRLAQAIAAVCGGEAVISTATDVEGKPAVDALALDSDLVIGRPEQVKAANAALLRGERLSLSDPEGHLNLHGYDAFFTTSPVPEAADVRVTWKADDSRGLVLSPRVLFAGVGCRRHVSEDEILSALRDTFACHNLALNALAGLASVDRKADEAGLVQAAATLGVPFVTYPAQELDSAGAFSFSPKAWELLGLAGVAEPAALRMAAERGAAMLLVPKTKHGPVTVAVARLGALWKKA